MKRVPITIVLALVIAGCDGAPQHFSEAQKFFADHRSDFTTLKELMHNSGFVSVSSGGSAESVEVVHANGSRELIQDTVSSKMRPLLERTNAQSCYLESGKFACDLTSLIDEDVMHLYRVVYSEKKSFPYKDCPNQLPASQDTELCKIPLEGNWQLVYQTVVTPIGDRESLGT